MKILFLLILLMLGFSAHADSFKSRIHSIDLAKNSKQSHLILMENGRVVFVGYYQNALLDTFKESLRLQDTLEVEVDDKNNFLNAETVEETQGPSTVTSVTTKRMSYDPTIVTSNSAASAIFRRMRRDYQNDSQCYNRAHVWAYEEFQNSGLKSSKLFLFFTRRYIRNYRYKWWFHVSPMALVKQGSSIVERVLDRRYTGGPRYVSTWTRNFVHSGRKCPVVYKYYDYRNNQETEDCYLIPVSMYFWQPRDIERRDRTGAEKTQFFKREINHAYWEAF